MGRNMPELCVGTAGVGTAVVAEGPSVDGLMLGFSFHIVETSASETGKFRTRRVAKPSLIIGNYKAL